MTLRLFSFTPSKIIIIPLLRQLCACFIIHHIIHNITPETTSH